MINILREGYNTSRVDNNTVMFVTFKIILWSLHDKFTELLSTVDISVNRFRKYPMLHHFNVIDQFVMRTVIPIKCYDKIDYRLQLYFIDAMNAHFQPLIGTFCANTQLELFNSIQAKTMVKNWTFLVWSKIIYQTFNSRLRAYFWTCGKSTKSDLLIQRNCWNGLRKFQV